MLVEVHKIEKSINGAPVLTVTGRSFETVLERRVAALTGGVAGTMDMARVPWFENRTEPSDAAYHVLRKILGDQARDLPEPYLGVFTAETPRLSPNDALPMVDLPIPVDYEYDPLAADLKNFEIKPGSLYAAVMELLTLNHHALKAVRPDHNGAKISIEIYNGADLTNVVVFDAKFDQFESTTYLLSETGSTNWAYVFSKTDSQTVDKTQATVEEPSGLDRRVLFVDISSEEGVETEEARNTRGLIELYKYNATALFDGQISEQVAVGYNRDYFLGDIIRLDGEYGLSQNVRVAEFIRSDDTTGSKAYPTFEGVQ